MSKQIIAFIGRAGSGKDYQCELLEEEGYIKLAFADALRDIAFSCLKINKQTGLNLYDELKANNFIHIDLNSIDNNFKSYSLNFRQFLEYLGTQGIRNYDNNFWCRCLINFIKENNLEKICISDMRFLNEYTLLKDFSQNNNYEFKVIFCDYKSERYQTNNNHESAKMSNYFANSGYKDLQVITAEDMLRYELLFTYAESFRTLSSAYIYDIIKNNYSDIKFIHNLTSLSVFDSSLYESILNKVKNHDEDLYNQVNHEVLCNLAGI